MKDIIKITRYTKAPIFVIGDILQPGEEYAYTVLQELKKASFKSTEERIKLAIELTAAKGNFRIFRFIKTVITEYLRGGG